MGGAIRPLSFSILMLLTLIILCIIKHIQQNKTKQNGVIIMEVQRMSYRDMAIEFTEHNESHGKENAMVGVIVFHPMCFKPLYRDLKYRSYIVTSDGNAWNKDAEDDYVTAYCMADKNNTITFNNVPQMSIEYCYIV